MRAAEAAAIAAGTPVETLMERAGTAAAEAIWRFAGPLPALVLCGPGNNGGDGYVIARALAARGVAVRVAALGRAEERCGARGARQPGTGPVETLADAAPAPLLIDALFGTGLARPLDEALSRRLLRLAAAARVRVAVDLPSGVATDDGAILSPVPDFDLTVTFQTLKPSHLLQPAARHMGRIVVADIGIAAESRLARDRPPAPARAPGPDDHKYTRGYVAVLAGEMPGASALAAAAALRGRGRLCRGCRRDGRAPASPAAVVQTPGDPLDRLDDRADRRGRCRPGPRPRRRGASAARRGARLPAIRWCSTPTRCRCSPTAGWRARSARRAAILTPHEGEFAPPVRRAGGQQGRARPAPPPRRPAR